MKRFTITKSRGATVCPAVPQTSAQNSKLQTEIPLEPEILKHKARHQ
jgi:hypothetical protein